jgi:hypothetical protein
MELRNAFTVVVTALDITMKGENIGGLREHELLHEALQLLARACGVENQHGSDQSETEDSDRAE